MQLVNDGVDRKQRERSRGGGKVFAQGLTLQGVDGRIARAHVGEVQVLQDVDPAVDRPLTLSRVQRGSASPVENATGLGRGGGGRRDSPAGTAR